MSASAGLALMDFTAYELPSKKWMKLVPPKMRLSVRVQNRDFVSSAANVRDPNASETSVMSVCWPWSNQDEQLSRPLLADDQLFEVEVQRRFLLRYKCIRRTKPVTLDQVRMDNHCALPLYDGHRFGPMLEDRIEIGEITFSLRSDASSEDTWSAMRLEHHKAD